MDLVKVVEKEKFQVVVTLAPDLAEIDGPTEARIVELTREGGVKWLALPHVLDELLYVVQQPEHVLGLWDVVCTIGPRCVDWLEEWLRSEGSGFAERVRQKVLPVGYPELDGLDRLDPAMVRRKYDIPAGKPVILMASPCGFPALYPETGYFGRLIRKGIYDRFLGIRGLRLQSRLNAALSYLKAPLVLPYKRYLQALRRLADRNGALLVCKTRAKDRSLDSISTVADLVVCDQSYYPFTTLELMSVADLYLGFESATIFESLAARVFSVTAMVGSLWSFSSSPADQSLTSDLFLGRDGLWGLPGMSQTLMGSQWSSRRSLDRLAKMDLSELKFQGEESASVLEGLISNLGRASEATVEIMDAVFEGRIK